MFLIYELNILNGNNNFEPIDFENKINHSNTLKNEEVYKKYKEMKKYCPCINELNEMNKKQFNIDYNFIDIYYFHSYIECLFFKINNIHLLENEKIENTMDYPEYNFIRTLFDRTIKIKYNFLKEYNKYYHSNFVKLKNEINKKQKLNLKKIEINNLLKTKLFDYQIDNIHWMINREKKQIKHLITNKRLLFLTDNRVFDLFKNKIYNQNEIKKTFIRGGIIADESGLGKTLQILCLCASNVNIKTLILCPLHLVEHWKMEMKKHFVEKMIHVHVHCFDDFNQNTKKFKNGYRRIVVDEIHELYPCKNKKNEIIFEKLVKINCKYKWCLTSTPFLNENSLFYLLKYLTNYNLMYKNIIRSSYIWNLFSKIIKKHNYENVSNEIILKKIKFHDIFLEFNMDEQMTYDNECKLKKTEKMLRNVCCDIIIEFSNSNIININDFKNEIIQKYKEKLICKENELNFFQEFYKKMNFSKNYKNDFKKLVLQLDTSNTFTLTSSDKDLIDKSNIIIETQNNEIEQINKTINYIETQINVKKECYICLEDIDDENSIYCILSCFHSICKKCCNVLLFKEQENSKCPLCRKSLIRDEIYTISGNDELKYSSKINYLITMIDKMNDKIIIYSNYEKITSKLYQIFEMKNIESVIFKDNYDIERYKNNKAKILLLNSKNNYSGIDLTFVKNLVIFEPFHNEFEVSNDIKNQLIGRIKRIGQNNEMNIYSLTMKNTIEEKFFSSL